MIWAYGTSSGTYIKIHNHKTISNNYLPYYKRSKQYQLIVRTKRFSKLKIFSIHGAPKRSLEALVIWKTSGKSPTSLGRNRVNVSVKSTFKYVAALHRFKTGSNRISRTVLDETVTDLASVKKGRMFLKH